MEFPVAWKLGGEQWLYLFLLMISVSLLAGIYPALVLSKVKLTSAVKGKLRGSKSSLALRRVLLVTQFSLAVFIFICALNISQQVRFIFNKDLGYDKEQLLIVTALPKQWDSAGVAKMEVMKREFMQLSGVQNVSIAFDIPDQVPFGKWEVLAPKSSSSDRQITLSLVTADEDYAKTLGLTTVGGSFFGNGKDGIVLNETAVKQLGESTDKIIGKKIKTIAGDDGVVVRGVVKDYNYSSMQNTIAPIGFLHVTSSNNYRFLIVKLNTNHIAKDLEGIKDKWKAMSPNTPFNYSFMDEKFGALYKTELQLQKASRLAAVLNLIIVLLGITGVVAFMLQKKVKEIAVRKVLGAGAIDIIAMFIREYAGLLLIANLIAWPIAYFVSERILQQFAYRTSQHALSYIIALALVASLSFLLVTLQSFRTASANPVKSLKIE